MILTLSRIVGVGGSGPESIQRSSSPSGAGWQETTAVRNDNIFEMKSTYILQPGPAALTGGVRQLHALLAHVVGVKVSANES